MKEKPVRDKHSSRERKTGAADRLDEKRRRRHQKETEKKTTRDSDNESERKKQRGKKRICDSQPP